MNHISKHGNTINLAVVNFFYCYFKQCNTDIDEMIRFRYGMVYNIVRYDKKKISPSFFFQVTYVSMFD